MGAGCEYITTTCMRHTGSDMMLKKYLKMQKVTLVWDKGVYHF